MLPIPWTTDDHVPSSPFLQVTPGSLANKCGLQVGDAIAKIGDTPTDGLRHKDAQSLIMRAGNSLELSLVR